MEISFNTIKKIMLFFHFLNDVLSNVQRKKPKEKVNKNLCSMLVLSVHLLFHYTYTYDVVLHVNSRGYTQLHTITANTHVH